MHRPSAKALHPFPDILVALDIPSGESGSIARNCPTQRLTCEETCRTFLWIDFLILFCFSCRIPSSNGSYTYVFLPQNFLRDLFASYGTNLPPSLSKSDLDPNDTIPASIDPSEISYLSKFSSILFAFFVLTRKMQ